MWATEGWRLTVALLHGWARGDSVEQTNLLIIRLIINKSKCVWKLSYPGIHWFSSFPGNKVWVFALASLHDSFFFFDIESLLLAFQNIWSCKLIIARAQFSLFDDVPVFLLRNLGPSCGARGRSQHHISGLEITYLKALSTKLCFFLEHVWNYSVWHCHGKYVALCICQNPQDFTTQRWKPYCIQIKKLIRKSGDARKECRLWWMNLTVLQIYATTSLKGVRWVLTEVTLKMRL